MKSSRGKLSILVVNPGSRFTKNVVRDVLYGCWCKGKRIGGGTVPPFALLQVATILKNEGHNVIFLDAQAEQRPYEKVLELAGSLDLVVTSTSTMSYVEDADYLQGFKKKNPALMTAVFGSHPTFMPVTSLGREGIDVIVLGEPEFILRDLAATLADGGELTSLKGIGYRDAEGSPVVNERYPFIEDLDSLPFPDVSLLPRDIDYFNPIVRRMPYMTLTTSKGCPGQCTFCTAPFFDGKKIRFQSAGYVVEEIKYLVEQGYREVYFRDDTFFVNKKRDVAVCEAIIERGLDVSWLANARVNLIDLETMLLARRAGCHTIKIGIESGVQKILDGVKKGYRLERARQVFSWARQAGLRTHAHVMIGIPGDSRATVAETIRFVKKLRPSTATFGICTPYPGTPLFEMVQRKCPEIGDGTSTNLANLHVEGLYNEYYTTLRKEELADLVKSAYRRFYLRPSYWVQVVREQFRGIDDIKRVSIAAANVLDFAVKGDA